MDRKPLQNPEILRLCSRSAAARATLGAEMDKLKHRLDMAGRLRDSLKSKPASWLLGSTVAGLAAGFLFPRFRRAHSSAAPAPHSKSTTMRLLGLAWSAAQPFLKVWATKQLQSWLTQRAMTPHPENHPRNQPR